MLFPTHVPNLVGEVYNAIYVTDSSGTYATYGRGEWSDLYWDFCNVILYDNTMKQQYPFNQTYVVAMQHMKLDIL